MSHTEKTKVYRLRNIPAYADRLVATQLIATAINDPCVTAGDIQIFSLAPIVETWKKWQTKVATLTFKKTPAILLQKAAGTRNNEVTGWRFGIPGSPEPLILDTHFHGLTVLNEVNPSSHQYDCIVVSGLASHPFGSWQPKDDDRSFMWIRDALPQNLPGIRFLLYGYDTSLVGSKSFQTIVDIARTLLAVLEANIWAGMSTKPLFFLAHSLGGVILKQLFIMLADGNDRSRYMLDIIKGAIFFGTPSVGMPLSHLLRMVENQPNSDLVEALSDQSSFLKNLETQFWGISLIESMKIFWAYETQTSPTVKKDSNGQYKRTGPSSIMVDRHSATSGHDASDPLSIIQIDEDHSNMVKFSLGDQNISIMVKKIRDICQLENNDNVSVRRHRRLTLAEPIASIPASDDSYIAEAQIDFSWKEQEKLEWDHELLLQAIQPPGRDSRLGQIDQNFGHSFHWAFTDTSVGLTDWLRRGKGLYWISGKPGSGKSTFMKFLLNDERTKDLLHTWHSRSSKIVGNFFFHHRGSLLQKSFDGLLRSLLSQLLEEEPRLRSVIVDPILDAKFRDKSRAQWLGTLETDLELLATWLKIPERYKDELASILAHEPVSLLNSLLKTLPTNYDDGKRRTIKDIILNHYLSWSGFSAKHGSIQQKQKAIISDLLKDESLELKSCEENLRQLVTTWCNSVNLTGLLENFIRQHCIRLTSVAKERRFSRHTENFSQSHVDLHHFAEAVKAEAGDYIDRVAGSHLYRHQARLSVMRESWSRFHLEESLGLALTQDVLDIELCLFFDALDEYEGQHEVICDFLKDLVRNPSGSRTKTKVLFSSRPWAVFQDEFKSCAGFELHKHTEEDIREYCTSLLPATKNVKHFILPLTEEIVRRARGVFLWVKLVMRDLGQVVNTKKAPSQLRQRLDSLPDELDDYYSTIVSRLPSHIRMKTFILLETVSRSSKTLRVQDVEHLIGSSLAETMHEYVVGYDRGAHNILTHDYLRTISGGLVDITGEMVIQLLHQTCKEWVEASTFKHIVLGDRASVTWENGHSFLMKLHALTVLRSREPDHFRDMLFHAREAEKTTGVSQYKYLSRLTSHFYKPIGAIGFPQISTALCIAVYGGLRLYLAELINHDRCAIMNTKEPLFSILLDTKLGVPNMAQSSRIEIGRFLLEHGFDLSKDRTGIALIMLQIWRCSDIQCATSYVELIKLALDRSLNPNISFPIGDYLFYNVSRSLDPFKKRTNDVLGWRLLHFSPPPLAQWLLEHGSLVNKTNSAQQTPLDYVVHPESAHHTCRFGMDWLYEMVCLLVRSGGVLRSTEFYDINRLIERLTDGGYDTTPLIPLYDMVKRKVPSGFRIPSRTPAVSSSQGLDSFRASSSAPVLSNVRASSSVIALSDTKPPYGVQDSSLFQSSNYSPTWRNIQNLSNEQQANNIQHVFSLQPSNNIQSSGNVPTLDDIYSSNDVQTSSGARVSSRVPNPRTSQEVQKPRKRELFKKIFKLA